jgi:hypothetical protein
VALEPSPLYLVDDGSALDRRLHRIVKRWPSALDDFASYEALRHASDLEISDEDEDVRVTLGSESVRPAPAG